ncbi:MAG: DUF971 domain-containing protein [Gammaproteobacteria bacterium]|nr:DUF971 domain-containing protein [Gammaproteobacteria bacterium]
MAANGASIHISSHTGNESVITAAELREAAMDAGSKRERIDKGFIEVSENIRITEINRVGSTGVNIHFSDGHRRAIYPYAYLSNLASLSDK